MPSVDFTRNVVIAIFSGMKPSTGHSVAVRKLSVQKEKVTVEVEFIQPGEGCFEGDKETYPFQIIEVARISSPLHFAREDVERPC